MAMDAASAFRYPTEWIDSVRLRDSRQIVIRPVLPQDDTLEREFVAHGMTAKSRYLRFLIGMRELPQEVARSFTQIDYHNHFALLAESFDNGQQVQVGDARFVREDPASHSAEFAIAIADAWQGLGLGRQLLRLIVKAAHAHGVQQLYGDVLHENTPMLALAGEHSFTKRRHPEDPRLLRVQRDLVVDAPVDDWENAALAVLARAARGEPLTEPAAAAPLRGH
jgi:acetyltransferase